MDHRIPVQHKLVNDVYALVVLKEDNNNNNNNEYNTIMITVQVVSSHSGFLSQAVLFKAQV